jgi:hypothetical protein
LLAREKGNNKHKVLEMYAEVIKKEKAKLKVKKPKEDSDSESEMSVQVVKESTLPKIKKRKINYNFKAEAKKVKEDTMPEEKVFLKKMMAEETSSEDGNRVLSDASET